MSKKQKVIIAIGLAVFILGAVSLWLIVRSPDKELLQENPNLPESEWSRTIQIEEDKSGFKTLSNRVDGYEITVPVEWKTAEIAASGGYGVNYSNLDLDIFVISSVEDAKLIFPETARFTEVEIPAGNAYKSSNKVLGEDFFQNGKTINPPIEDSLSVGYVVPAKEKTYVILCSAIGSNFKELVSLCEKQILTFKILK